VPEMYSVGSEHYLRDMRMILGFVLQLRLMKRQNEGDRRAGTRRNKTRRGGATTSRWEEPRHNKLQEQCIRHNACAAGGI